MPLLNEEFYSPLDKKVIMAYSYNNYKFDPPLSSFQNSVCVCVCLCVRVCVCAYGSDTFPPLIPAYIFTTGHAIMLVSSSAGQGTLAVMTSLRTNSCGVNKCSSTLTPEAKRDMVKDCRCWLYCTF